MHNSPENCILLDIEKPKKLLKTSNLCSKTFLRDFARLKTLNHFFKYINLGIFYYNYCLLAECGRVEKYKKPILYSNQYWPKNP